MLEDDCELWRALLLELDVELDDLELGTSRILSSRPVVGSVVEGLAGSWETW